MNQKKTLSVLLLLSLIFYARTFAQEIKLEITSKNEIEKKVLSKIDYKKKHIDTTSVLKETQKISSFLKNTGYFINSIDSITNKSNTYRAYFSLNDKINTALISVSKNHLNYFKNFKIEKDTILIIPIANLQNTLINVSKKLDKEGKSFSKVKLKNISIVKETLFAELDINQSKQRIINKIFVKGYDKFPTSFLKNYFNLSKKTVFNQKKLNEVSTLSKSLEFVKEIKPPEVLFTKDSTTLYIYLKKKKNNSFDGIVNFASKEDGELLFNGNIDLQLNNILNTGENFTLFWNSVAEERQEFKLSTKIPYIFNFKFSPEIAFNIYKQDSTFYNTIFTSSFNYNINARLKLGLHYRNEISENLKASSNDISSFKSNLFGLILNYSILQKDIFNNKKFSFTIKPSFGSRITESLKSNQIRIESNISYVWKLNQRNSIYIENETGFLNSEKYFTNELFRIGGINSLRGFNEQSIFSRSYTFFNLEYRFLVSNTSYIYSITDFGVINNSNTDNLLGLGFGYQFIKNNSKINLGLIVGKTNKLPLNFNMTKLAVGWVNYF